MINWLEFFAFMFFLIVGIFVLAAVVILLYFWLHDKKINKEAERRFEDGKEIKEEISKTGFEGERSTITDTEDGSAEEEGIVNGYSEVQRGTPDTTEFDRPKTLYFE
jgi:hypothetical protein